SAQAASKFIEASNSFMPLTSLGLSSFAFIFIKRKVVALRPHQTKKGKALAPLLDIPQRPGEI
ncbi:hypothetical protein L2755_22065, partial [Shewanella abyssi]|uniref:hypothetical protein n=1 Tax=Shewanella abyssi TaxID=311789 RepID=UPI00201041E2